MDKSLNHASTTEGQGSLAWIEWGCLAIAAAGLVGFRLHAFDLPLETDECNYAYIGSRLLAGDRLYVDVWDHQPFGVFVLVATLIRIFGDAPEAFRWTAMMFSLGSLGLIFAIVRRCAGRGAAIMAAVLFALASSDPGTAGEGCNREIYMNTFVLAAWYLAIHRPPGKSDGAIFASGVVLGLGSTLKTILAVHWFMLAFWIVLTAAQHADGGQRVRKALRVLALFAVGPAIIWIGSLAYFAATNRLDDFVDAVFLFNLGYSGSSEAFLSRFARFFSPPRHPFVFDSAMPLWIGSIGATVWLVVRSVRARCGDSTTILLMLAGSYLAVCLPARFWPHYYYLLVPPAVIAVSVALGQLLARWIPPDESARSERRSGLARRNLTTPRLESGEARPTGVRVVQQTTTADTAVAHTPAAQGRTKSRALRRGSLLALAILPIWLFNTEYDSYLSQKPFGITIDRYNSRDFWGRAIGEKVRDATDPGDTVFVYGNEAEVYYYAQRRCASRFTMITALHAGYAGAEARCAILLSELEQRLPRIIIVLFDEAPFDGWLAFLERHYGKAIGLDRHDLTGKTIMAVFARKDQPLKRPGIDWNWDRSEVGGWFPKRNRVREITGGDFVP